MAENAERQNYFADVAKDGQEDLLKELEGWEAEAAEMEMDIKSPPVISNKPGPNKIQAKPRNEIVQQAVNQDEELDDLDTCERPISRRPTVNVTKEKRAIWPGLR